MTVVLPPEVWREIASFIPPRLLLTLYKVNRAFLHIVLEQKYKVIQIETQDIKRYHEIMLSPVHAQYVRSLRLWPRFIETQSRKSFLKRLLHQFTFVRHDHQVLKNAKNVLRILDGFSSLTSLEVKLNRYHLSTPGFFSVIHSSWDIVSGSGSLRSLSLDIPLEGWERCIPASLIFLDLEKLDITLSRSFVTTDATSLMRTAVAPFINTHRETLRSLHLKPSRVLYKHDLSMLLHEIQHLPHLTCFDISYDFVSIQQSNTTALARFLRSHSDHLQELGLHIWGPPTYSMDPSSAEWYNQEFFDVKLPRLKKLILGLEMFPLGPHIAQYPSNFGVSLTSLVMIGRRLSYADVEAIAIAFSQHDILRVLDISVLYLSPALLSLLACDLPNLEMLCIAYRYLSLDAPLSVEESFGTHSITGWKLLHLIAHPTGGYVSPMHIHSYTEFIKHALPKLKTLRLTDNFDPFY